MSAKNQGGLYFTYCTVLECCVKYQQLNHFTIIGGMVPLCTCNINSIKTVHNLNFFKCFVQPRT